MNFFKEAKTTTKIFYILTLVLILWIGSGKVFHKSKEKQKAEQITPKVRVVKSTTKMRGKIITLIGKTEANKNVTIKAETSGKIIYLAKQGKVVKKGEIIAKIQIKDRKAQVAKARANVATAKLKYNTAKSLNRRQYASKTQLLEAQAILEEAKAVLAQSKEELTNTTIKAPFSGRLDSKFISLGDYVSIGQDIFRILDLSKIKAKAGIAEIDVKNLDKNAVAIFKDINNNYYKAKITFISRSADVTTRTFMIEFLIDNSSQKLYDGMSVEVLVTTKPFPSHFISPSILTLNEEGIQGIKIVDENNLVKFVPIEIMYDTKEGMWITSKDIPDKATIITLGQEYVKEGIKVEYEEVKGLEASESLRNQIIKKLDLEEESVKRESKKKDYQAEDIVEY